MFIYGRSGVSSVQLLGAVVGRGLRFPSLQGSYGYRSQTTWSTLLRDTFKGLDQTMVTQNLEILETSSPRLNIYSRKTCCLHCLHCLLVNGNRGIQQFNEDMLLYQVGRQLLAFVATWQSLTFDPVSNKPGSLCRSFFLHW